MEATSVTVNAAEAGYFNPPAGGFVPVAGDVTASPGVDDTTRIQKALSEIANRKKEIKLRRNRIKDLLMADPNYSMADKDVKAKQKTRKSTKVALIASSGELTRLTSELKDLLNDNRAQNAALSGWFIEYKNRTGQTSIFDAMSNRIEFEVVARVKQQGLFE